MPLLSVFTPSHRPTYLEDCLASLLNQTFEDWEWIVLLNGGVQWTPSVDDVRVKILHNSVALGVGAAKREACANATGEYLVELDHDDILSSDALLEIAAAFEAHPEIGFVYSHFAQINEDKSRNYVRFNESMGWKYRDVVVDGVSYLQCDSMEPLPSNVSYIWYAPNHVRAFRRSVYDAVGGYNPELKVLDDQDLMSRLYVATEFFLIDKCLYLQRIHELNTQKDPETNAFIQRETVRMYDETVTANALAWASRRGLKTLDLGAAHSKPAGFLGVDQYPGEGVDIVCDVAQGIDLPDQSVGVIRASDFLEHIVDKVSLFNELYRLLAHGGMLLSLTPSTDGRGAYQDPTHVAFYNENSFWYFTSIDYAKYVPSITCRFQSARLVTYFPTPFHEQHNIPYVCAHLVAVHSGPRVAGIAFDPSNV
jgi:glycosyltransferase involved in cell wall biosynthesis